MIDRAKLAVIAAIVVGFSGWCYERDGRLREEGRAEVAEERADSLEGVEVLLLATLDTTRENRVLAEARLDSVAEAAAEEVERIQRERPVVIDSIIVEAGADSAVVRQAVERVSATYEAELEAERAEKAELRATVWTLQAEVLVHEERDVVQENLIAALRESNRARAGTRQGFLARNTERALVGLAGFAVGVLAAEVVR